MKFKRIELGIKIGALGDEARRIRNKEQTLLWRARREQMVALAKHKGIAHDQAPEDLKAELQRRVTPQVARVAQNNPEQITRVLDKGARKVIKSYLRNGLSKEDILAIPLIQKSFKYYPIYDSLRFHRKGIVRHESRHAQAALGFLRDRPFNRIEDRPNSFPNWDKVAEIASRFSDEDKRILMQKFEQWSQEANSFIRGRQIMNKGKHFFQEPMKIITVQLN
jgi:hypothetical protein